MSTKKLLRVPWLADKTSYSADVPRENLLMKKVDKVKEKLKHLFIANSITYLVRSWACGADLIALDIAGQLNISRKMVLPFDAETFRSTSVIDRP